MQTASSRTNEMLFLDSAFFAVQVISFQGSSVHFVFSHLRTAYSLEDLRIHQNIKTAVREYEEYRSAASQRYSGKPYGSQLLRKCDQLLRDIYHPSVK
jgi:hypothetical protein